MNVKQKKLVELTLHASYPCQFQILEIFPRGFEIQLTYLRNLWEKVLYAVMKASIKSNNMVREEDLSTIMSFYIDLDDINTKWVYWMHVELM